MKNGKTYNNAKMTQKAARRIQSHSDRTGKGKAHKARAMRAAAKNSKK